MLGKIFSLSLKHKFFVQGGKGENRAKITSSHQGDV